MRKGSAAALFFVALTLFSFGCIEGTGLSISTDKPSYALGEKVVVKTSSAKNVSEFTCREHLTLSRYEGGRWHKVITSQPSEPECFNGTLQPSMWCDVIRCVNRSIEAGEFWTWEQKEFIEVNKVCGNESYEGFEEAQATPGDYKLEYTFFPQGDCSGQLNTAATNFTIRSS